ncbi:MAG: sigma-54-dependent Fis family transcriptional regulator [Acidobacteria bacterium]|nr:sigma-54-dependent Fis family transcriptional regulator [Acidobacteriota bacterium]
MTMPAADLSRSIAHAPRQRERRDALSKLLGALMRTLDRQQDVSLMRGAFEEMVRHLIPLRTVQLRDGGLWATRLESVPGAESVVLEVPSADPLSPGVLEVTFDPGCGLGEWDFQMLGVSAQLGALVLELERSRLQLARAGLLAGNRPRRDNTVPLIGSTPGMQNLRSTIDRVAATDFTVLLEGESGVGKELVARRIHNLSHRRNGPFVAINCAALVETLLEAELFGIEDRTATGVRGRRGKFETADGGTLFLDEVSDLSVSAQAKLLRAIQDLAVERVGGQGSHRVDIRIIAATNRSLAPLVERQLFRPDLFYRLSGVDVRVPTLRERRSDILELANYFLDCHRSTRSLQLSPAAADALVTYDWPGNVRELERLIERAVTLTASETIELDDLPLCVGRDYAAALGPSLSRDETLRTWASRYARLILARCQGNKREASDVLGISYHTLQAYLRHPVHESASRQAPIEDDRAESSMVVESAV